MYYFYILGPKNSLSNYLKNTEKFNVLENRLFEKFSEYKESENYFTFNGNKINKYMTIDENNIKNGDVILLNVFD